MVFHPTHALSLFQSTHPRGVRLLRKILIVVKDHISIHAPARGATHIPFLLSSCHTYFNPRTRAGCDRSLILMDRWIQNFNPRTRAGCDSTPQAYIVSAR